MVPMLSSNIKTQFSGRNTYWRSSWCSTPQCETLPLRTPQILHIYSSV